jgi:hypothetical protein
MYKVCTGMYLVSTKTLNWQVLWTSGCGSLDVASLAGGLTIEETAEWQDAARKASDKRGKETHEGRKGDCA